MSEFSTDVRVLLCPRCGAPGTLPATGGTLQCAYCGATAIVAARLDHFAGSALSPDQERARIQRLWLQKQREGTTDDPYGMQNVLSDIVHLAALHGSALREPWLQAWKRALGILQQVGDAESQRRVYWLAICSANSDLDRAHTRAIYETALELLADPGHRHVIRCALASSATRAGDLAAAERWLAGCDPAAANMSLDSAYRTSLATLQAARLDWQAVLATVGTGPEDLPLDLTRATTLGFLRVHALEATGHPKEDGEQLIAWVRAPQAARILERLAYLHLCEPTRARLGMA